MAAAVLLLEGELGGVEGGLGRLGHLRSGRRRSWSIEAMAPAGMVLWTMKA